MIKNFTPQPYDGLTALPDYVTSPRFYTLVGYAPGDYTVTLARMTVGEYIAAKNAMSTTGVEFHPALPCSCEAMLRSLGDWFMAHNPELSSVEVMSQTCH